MTKYMFLVNKLFLGSKGPLWRDYEEKFRRNQCGNATLPLGFKDVEVWLEVVGRTGAGGQKEVDVQPKRSFPAAKRVLQPSRKASALPLMIPSATWCRFRHSCRVCVVSHPAKDCSSQGGSTAGTRGEVGGGAP